MSVNEKEQVTRLIEKPLADEGCELAEVVLSRYKSSVRLRFFVYSEKGATLDECARLSRIVGDLIDGTDLFESGYTLEMSSPGLDRPLKTAVDFKYRVGETVRVDFTDSRRERVSAEILSVSGENVELKNDTGVFALALSEIEKARIVF